MGGKTEMKINRKKLKYGAAATVITIVVIVMVVLLNIIISALSDRYPMSFDITPGGDFEISEATKNYIASINEEVEICTTVDELFFQTTENKYYRQGYEVLKKYAQNSDMISLHFVDMTIDPTYVEKYQNYYSGGISSNSIILFNRSSNRIKVISVNDLYNTEINPYTLYSRIVSSKAEQVLTSALMYITDPDPKTAVYLNVPVSSQSAADASGENMVSILESNGFDVVIINPNEEAIPEDADMLIINAPLNDFSEELINSIYNFMENGGNYGKNMIYLADYYQNDTPNIDAFLAEWGVVIGDGLVSENNTQYIASMTSPFAILTHLEANDYTGGIPAETLEYPVVAFNARPIELLFEYSGNVSTLPLLTTSETGFSLPTEVLQDHNQNGADLHIEERKVPVIAITNKYTFIDNKQVLSNILVISSSNILNSGFTSIPAYNNGDYFISIVNKMSGKETGITIVAKDFTSETYETNVTQYNVIKTVFVFVLPGIVAVIGLIVWLRRRHR